MIKKELKIIENYLDNESCEYLSSFFRNTVNLLDQTPNSYPSKLGWAITSTPKSTEISKDAKVMPESDDDNVNKFSEIFTDLLLNIKKECESFFNQEMDFVNIGYHLMCPGAHNGLHSDSTNLDGSVNSPDGVPEPQEFSALLYLNSYKINYTGGRIIFPKQDLIVEPSVGTLIIFRGNEKYPHEVERIKTGLRDTVVIFLGKRGQVSDREMVSFI